MGASGDALSGVAVLFITTTTTVPGRALWYTEYLYVHKGYDTRYYLVQYTRYDNL